MRKTQTILLATILIGCSSTRTIDYKTLRKGYDYINYDKKFEIILTEIYQCNGPSCWAKNFTLMIGKTNGNKLLPTKVSVLSSWENFSNFKIGDTVTINPVENESLKDTITFPTYFIKDTIINRQKKQKIIGSENKAIWGKPLILNK